MFWLPDKGNLLKMSVNYKLFNLNVVVLYVHIFLRTQSHFNRVNSSCCYGNMKKSDQNFQLQWRCEVLEKHWILSWKKWRSVLCVLWCDMFECDCVCSQLSDEFRCTLIRLYTTQSFMTNLRLPPLILCW